ncbi:MAG TPA: ribonuclease J [Candidatus Saccharimonadales bacterium]
MGQQRTKNPSGDDSSKRPNHQNKRKPPDTSVMASANIRRGEVMRASRRNSQLVNARASQHIIDVPVNKNEFNGRTGQQFTTGDLRRANQLPIAKEKTLKVIPLGGLGEMGIGKNMALIEYERDIIVIDMGLLFPGNDYPGINYMVPDISYLEARKSQIRGIIFTHAHLDHVGAVKHLLKKIPAPIYGSKFTISMVQRQMEEDPSGFKANLNVLDPDKHERVQLGESFNIELIRVNHSVPDSTSVVVKTPVGTVINTGDWRFEKAPVDGKMFDFKRFEEIAKDGVLLLMNESTNCEYMSEIEHGEPDIKDSFDEIMNREGRIIISAFSTQIHRIQSVLEAAQKHERKVAFAGYSMIQNLEVALRAGAIKIPKGVVVKMDDIIKLPDSKVVVVATGSQGEMNAVLWRMATGAHRHIRVKPTDTIVFSSNPIPGNEVNVVKTVDGLMREGSHVLENRIREFDGCGPLHISGHGNYYDHVKLLNIIKPKYYMPIHGEFHMLVHNAEMTHREMNLPKENIFVMDNGDVLEMTANQAVKTGRVKVGSIMYDNSAAEVSEVVLKDRLHMSTDGIFTVILTVNKQGQLMTSPDIISRGFIYLRDSEELINKIRRYLKQKIAKAYSGRRPDLDDLKKAIREDIAHLLYDETEHTPIVIPVINEVNGQQSGGGHPSETKPSSR